MNKIREILEFLKKYKSITLILIICAIVFVLIFSENSCVVEKREFDTVATVTVPNDLISPRDYSIIDGNYYVSQSIDPQIFLIPNNWPTANDLTIKFAKPLETQTMVQLFVECGDYGISEERSQIKMVKRGETEVYFTLPYDDYTLMRVDINGSFWLDSISVSHLDNVKYYNFFQVLWLEVIICLLIIAVIITFSIIFRDKVEEYYNILVNSLFSTDNTELGLNDSNSSRRLANRYMAIALFFGSFLLFFMPAIAVPDENFHFLNVLRVSHFQFVPSVKNGIEGVYLTYDEVQFLKEFGNVNNTTMTWDKFSKLPFTSSAVTEFFPTEYARTNFLGHFLPGMAVAIFRAFFEELDIYSCIIIARFTNLVVSVLITRWAIMITPIFKNTMFLFALMPVTLQQISSASYDSILIASSFLLFAIATKIIKEPDDYRITAKDIITVILAVVGICTMKAPYALIAVFLFSISIKKFGSLKRYFLCIGLILASGVVFCLLPVIAYNAAVSEIPQQNSTLSQQQISFLFSDILNIPRVFEKTYEFCHESWERQFFGVLGWLDFGLPTAFYVVFAVIFWITFVLDACKVGKISLKTRFFSFAAAAIVYIVIVMSMYISWNPKIGHVCGYVAYGTQGRYFIPLALFVTTIFSNSFLTKFKYLGKCETKVRTVIAAFSVICMLATYFAFFNRYWI